MGRGGRVDAQPAANDEAASASASRCPVLSQRRVESPRWFRSMGSAVCIGRSLDRPEQRSRLGLRKALGELTLRIADKYDPRDFGTTPRPSAFSRQRSAQV